MDVLSRHRSLPLGRGAVVLLAWLISAVTACGSGPVNTSPPGPSQKTTTATCATASPLQALAAYDAPPSRDGAAIGFDPVSGRLLLQGGGVLRSDHTLQVLGDTWAWDGKSWTQLHPTVEPPAMTNSAMAVDPTSGKLVLVGGSTQADYAGFPQTQPSAHGMWSWDGTTWRRVPSGDPPMQLGWATAAADPVTHQLLLNGTTSDGAAFSQPGHLVWDGHHWTVGPVPATPANAGPTTVAADDTGIAWDPISQRVIQYGGGVQQPFDTTAAWDGSRWTFLSPKTIPPPGTARAATDEARGQLLLVAGSASQQPSATTWRWSGENWVKLAATSSPLLNSAVTYDPVVRAVIAYVGPGSSLWAWDGEGWLKLPSAPSGTGPTASPSP